MFKDKLTATRSNPKVNSYFELAGALEDTKPEKTGLVPKNIAILRNFTIDPLVKVIQGEVALSGFYPNIYLSDYDSIAQEVLNPKSKFYLYQPDFIILAQWLETLSSSLGNMFNPLAIQKNLKEKQKTLQMIKDFITAIRKQTSAPILINNFPLPVYPTLGVLDSQDHQYHRGMILSLNHDLVKLAKRFLDIYIVDYFSLMAQIGSLDGIDQRYWEIGRAPISNKVLVPFGKTYGRIIRALTGKTKKCLVLDCDNTLWGGIIGEDMLDGIKLGKTYPGSCYLSLQQEILNLKNRGVILALCSKNNEEDVLEVLQNHPETLLREEHFSTWQINWDDKVSNLKQLAKDLNIGLDSFVFVDDSSFECELVRTQLPEVDVLELVGDPSGYRNLLSSQGFFDSFILSEEDQKRTHMYQAQIQRKKLKKSVSSIKDYLKSLSMEAKIGKANSATISRISQLTQKTNQFNLTTRRYSIGDIERFSQSKEWDVYYLKLKDRISDLGLIGVAIIKINDGHIEIDSFLLSCRVIGRGVEDVLLSHLLYEATKIGCQQVIASYGVTSKNAQVANFFGKRHFECLSKDKKGSQWKLDLTNKEFTYPDWIDVTEK